LCCSELATMMPRAGGVYVFFREAYGPAMGFLYGWTLFLVVQTGTIAAVAIAFAKFLGVFVSAISPDNYLFTKQPLSLVGGFAIILLLGKSMVGPLFAQTAWTNVTFLGSEVRDPGRNLVRALLIGSGIVVILYVLANVSYLALLPFSEIQRAPQDRVAVTAMASALGNPGAVCTASGVMCL